MSEAFPPNFFLFCTQISSFILQLDWNCSSDLGVFFGVFRMQTHAVYTQGFITPPSLTASLSHLSLVLLQLRLQSSLLDVRRESRRLCPAMILKAVLSVAFHVMLSSLL